MRTIFIGLATAAVALSAAAPASAAPECDIQDGRYALCMADYVYDRVDPRVPDLPPHIPPPGS